MDIGDICYFCEDGDCARCALGNPCIGCADYDGVGGCKSNGGCGGTNEVKDNGKISEREYFNL